MMKMKTSFLIIAFTLMGFFGTAYATIQITPFDIDITSDDFFESSPDNKYSYLIMKPGDSQQITIQVTNNDETTHVVNLFMAKETPRPERHFVFESSQLHLKPGETVSSTLTVTASPDADAGTTILHTLIMQSTSFGVKSFGFYVEIADQIIPPSPDLLRRDPPGIMFSPDTQFDISEDDAFEIIPYDVLPPDVSGEYSMQGMSGSKEEPRLIYSKEHVSENTGHREFWDDGGLLIIFEKEEFFSYEDHLQFLNPNEQQVQINGQDGISSFVELQTTDGEELYLNSRVTVFLDEDVKLRLESNMQEEELLRIAESMIKSNPVSEPTSEEEPYVDPDQICPPGLVLDWDICIDECRIGQIESNGICIEIISGSVGSIPSYFIITVASIFVIVIIVIVVIFMSRRKRK